MLNQSTVTSPPGSPSLRDAGASDIAMAPGLTTAAGSCLLLTRAGASLHAPSGTISRKSVAIPNYKQDKKRREQAQKKKKEEKQQQRQSSRKGPDLDPQPPGSQDPQAQ